MQLKKKFQKINVINLKRTPSLHELLQCFKTEEICFAWKCSEKFGNFVAIGLYAEKQLIFEKGALTIRNADKETVNILLPEQKDPILLVEEALKTILPTNAELEITGFGMVPMAMGFVSYDCARFFENISGMHAHESEPDICFSIPKISLVVDFSAGQLAVIANEEINYVLAEDIANYIVSRLEEPTSLKVPAVSEHSDLIQFSEKFTQVQFLEIVNRAQEYIKAGDIFQVVLSNSYFSPATPDPKVVLGVLEENFPSPFLFYVPFADSVILGASPELMLRVDPNPANSAERKASMRLVAGTYSNVHGSLTYPEDPDKSLLLLDEKERAEHIMLVDHVRNDLGRIAKIGSVKVDDLLCVETYKNVHHLVSEVSASLRENVSLLSALKSCFPIATLTGTPKIRAMEIIAELEQGPRGHFGGAIVLLGHDGSLLSTVSIRSLVLTPEGTTVRAGAGIVYDSIPEREFNECLWKASPAFKAASIAAKFS